MSENVFYEDQNFEETNFSAASDEERQFMLDLWWKGECGYLLPYGDLVEWADLSEIEKKEISDRINDAILFFDTSNLSKNADDGIKTEICEQTKDRFGTISTVFTSKHDEKFYIFY